jgi:hypothetical protein
MEKLKINKKLKILYSLLNDNYEILELELIELIKNPKKIGDSNRFATLLSDLCKKNFIKPLLKTISKSDESNFWLTDFMYAAANILDKMDHSELFDTPKKLLPKLEYWILEKEGELAWKAAVLLKFYESHKSEKIQLKKLEKDDFFLVHVECIIGLLRFDEKKYMPLVESIAADDSRNKYLREWCSEILLGMENK